MCIGQGTKVSTMTVQGTLVTVSLWQKFGNVNTAFRKRILGITFVNNAFLLIPSNFGDVLLYPSPKTFKLGAFLAFSKEIKCYIMREKPKLTGENLKVVRAEFSTLSWTVFVVIMGQWYNAFYFRNL
jgi:hypothetical protein